MTNASICAGCCLRSASWRKVHLRERDRKIHEGRVPASGVTGRSPADGYSGAGIEMWRGEFVGSSRFLALVALSVFGAKIPHCTAHANGDASGNAVSLRGRPKPHAPKHFGQMCPREVRESRAECRGAAPKIAPAEWIAIRCGHASWVMLKGNDEESAKKKTDVRKKKMPPPVPCASPVGNPLIEKGTSPGRFGSHYNPDDERRGWACERPEP